jgi:hypothetical protein
MLNTILWKRAKALSVVLVLSLLLTATLAFAATKLIKAKNGGTINIGPGVNFVIPPEALKVDTVISADMEWTDDYIYFHFGPSGTEFDTPAELRITWQAIDDMGLADLRLYTENGEEIEYEIRKWGMVSYYIEHFSLYYYRRR